MNNVDASSVITRATLKACMDMLSSGSAHYILDVTGDQWEILVSNKLWLSTDKSSARHALEQVLFGTLDILGLARYEVPVEYLASAIALIVHSSNLLPACHLMSGHISHRVDTMSQDDINSIVPITPRQLFALVIMARSESDVFKDRFYKQLNPKFRKKE